MAELFKDPVQLSKGIKLKDLLTSESEFHIDLNFHNKNNIILGEDGNMSPIMDDDDDEDDSDIEEVLKNLEDSAEKAALSSPEYHSFEELASKMVDCTPTGDVKMLIIEEGDGPLVPVDAEVCIHYAAYWEKSSVAFDTTLTRNDGEPIRVRLGRGEILPGLEVGLTSIRGPAGRVHLLLRPEAAWGVRGAPPRVLPQDVLFVVALYSVTDVQAATRFNDLPMEDQTKYEVTMRTVTSIHASAKKMFEKKKYKRAISNYQQAISVLSLSRPKTDAENAEIKNYRIKSYINLMMCYHKLDKPKYILNMADNLDHIIDIQKHCKALFYMGRAYELLGDTDKALTNFKKALKLEPKNKDIGKALTDLDERLKMAAINEKEMWRKTFKTNDKQKINYKVDEEFESSALEMMSDLSMCDDYTKYAMPVGLNTDEVACVKILAEKFEKIIVLEDGEGPRKKITLIKKA